MRGLLSLKVWLNRGLDLILFSLTAHLKPHSQSQKDFYAEDILEDSQES